MRFIFVCIFTCSYLISHAQLDGVNIVSYSSAPLKISFDDEAAINLLAKNNFGFQVNLASRFISNPKLIYEFHAGVDSYSFNLQPLGVLRSFFIHYAGVGISYEHKWNFNENNYLRLNGGISALHFIGARSKLTDNGQNKRITSDANIGNKARVVFSPRLSLDYNWQTSTLRSYRVGLYAATSFQNILRSDFTVIDDGKSYKGSFTKRHEIIGLSMGINISTARRQRTAERRQLGLSKNPKPIDHTFSKFDLIAHIGRSNKLEYMNSMPIKGFENGVDNGNYSFGLTIGRSIPVLDEYHALLEFSYRTISSKFNVLYRDALNDELYEIKKNLGNRHIVGGGIGYNFLRNKKNKINYFQFAALIKLNVNLSPERSYLFSNPVDGTELWNMSVSIYRRVYFTRKVSFDYFKKAKNGAYYRFGFSAEHGDLFYDVNLYDSLGQNKYVYQNDISFNLNFGITLLDRNR